VVGGVNISKKMMMEDSILNAVVIILKVINA
jgi:hypothetical protein